ncbi:MAG TPA: endonuclease/exonuclease/phosphatase family protein [Gemmatimonadota bacterium]|nr:endonuclease/exonuclease/phosphatase family protein [Gemmatimonadota bacterium]
MSHQTSFRALRPFPALIVAVLAGLLGACEAESPIEPVGPTTPLESMGFAERTPDSDQIRLMSRNVYQGFSSLAPLLQAAPQELPAVAAGIFGEVVATDFPARAEKLADEIAFSRPHLVGLQEVSRYRRQVPADFQLNATEDVYDFLEILLDALEARGLDYEVAANVQNIDAEVPILWPGSPNGLADIRLTDRDVILVRGDVAWDQAQAINYIARLPVSVGGQSLLVPRGFTSVRATVGDRTLRFVNTHLEAFSPLVQVPQAQQLIAMLAAETLPVALVGDLNSEADGSTTPTYGMMVAAGFADVWPPRGNGNTCCHAPSLLQHPSRFDQRIDFVLLRGDFGFGPGGIPGSTQSWLTGVRPSERTDSGLWPSDHAGIFTVVR